MIDEGVSVGEKNTRSPPNKFLVFGLLHRQNTALPAPATRGRLYQVASKQP